METLKIMDMAVKCFGSREAASAWMKAPAIALGGQRPEELLGDVAGRARLRVLITQIDTGTYI